MFFHIYHRCLFRKPHYHRCLFRNVSKIVRAAKLCERTPGMPQQWGLPQVSTGYPAGQPCFLRKQRLWEESSAFRPSFSRFHPYTKEVSEIKLVARVSPLQYKRIQKALCGINKDLRMGSGGEPKLTIDCMKTRHQTGGRHFSICRDAFGRSKVW